MPLRLRRSLLFFRTMNFEKQTQQQIGHVLRDTQTEGKRARGREKEKTKIKCECLYLKQKLNDFDEPKSGRKTNSFLCLTFVILCTNLLTTMVRSLIHQIIHTERGERERKSSAIHWNHQRKQMRMNKYVQ